MSVLKVEMTKWILGMQFLEFVICLIKMIRMKNEVPKNLNYLVFKKPNNYLALSAVLFLWYWNGRFLNIKS